MSSLIILVGLLLRNRASSDDSPQSVIPRGGILIPWFVVGFLTMSLIRTTGISAGVLPRNVDMPGALQMAASALNTFDTIAKFAILTALAGVGLGTRLQIVLKIGMKPFTLGLCVSVMLSVASLVLIILFRMG